MKAVENFLSDQVVKNKTPGLQYYYFNKDDILYSYAGGLADIEKQIKVTEATTFNAYSVTKTFTALAVLQLVERGLIDLDEPAADYLPDFPYPKKYYNKAPANAYIRDPKSNTTELGTYRR